MHFIFCYQYIFGGTPAQKAFVRHHRRHLQGSRQLPPPVAKTRHPPTQLTKSWIGGCSYTNSAQLISSSSITNPTDTPFPYPMNPPNPKSIRYPAIPLWYVVLSCLIPYLYSLLQCSMVRPSSFSFVLFAAMSWQPFIVPYVAILSRPYSATVPCVSTLCS